MINGPKDGRLAPWPGELREGGLDTGRSMGIANIISSPPNCHATLTLDTRDETKNWERVLESGRGVMYVLMPFMYLCMNAWVCM